MAHRLDILHDTPVPVTTLFGEPRPIPPAPGFVLDVTSNTDPGMIAPPQQEPDFGPLFEMLMRREEQANRKR